MSGSSTSTPSQEMCPVCGAHGARELRRFRVFPLLECEACGHYFLGVTGTAAQALADFYESHYQGFRSDPVFEAAVRRELDQHFLPRVAPPALVIDVGCGNGAFLDAARERGYRVFGLDFSSAAVEKCRERGLDAAAGDFLSYDFSRLGPVSFITLWDVLEHLPEPVRFIRRACEVLAPGGYLVIKTPKTGRRAVALARYVPRLAGPLLHAPTHIQYFSTPAMARLLRDGGFHSVDWLECRGMRGKRATRSVRTKLTRRIIRSLHELSGDGEFLVMARKEGHP